MNKEAIKTELTKRANELMNQFGHRGQSIDDIGYRFTNGPRFADKCTEIFYDIIREKNINMNQEQKEEMKSFIKPVINDLLIKYVHGK